jgi:ectoine hydroxylase-related dioxygenase (phytanoyl-CoA dioxygenase family)
MTEDLTDQYRKNGYAVARGVFDRYEIDELAHAFERVHEEAMMLGRSYRLQNVFFKITQDVTLRPVVRYVQWPSYFNRTLDRYRRSARVLKILAPMLGINVKQLINQMHWKPPGTANFEVGYHQDAQTYQPRDAFRDLANSFVQTGIAIDPQTAENGAMVVYPGSQTLAELPLDTSENSIENSLDGNDLERLGLDPDKAVTLDMEPGDVALWSVHTLHGSGPNRSNTDRRFYINGYIKAENSDRGEWAFRNGVSQPLSGQPSLVHYEELYDKPGPMFVD